MKEIQSQNMHQLLGLSRFCKGCRLRIGESLIVLNCRVFFLVVVVGVLCAQACQAFVF